LANWLKHTKQMYLSFLTNYVILLTRIKKKSISWQYPIHLSTYKLTTLKYSKFWSYSHVWKLANFM